MNRDVIEHPGSFRDPSGSLFFYEGQLYRRVNTSYQGNYEALITSGLYQRLTQENLLLPHQEVRLLLDDDPTIFRVIQPELIPFISYPYEWSFSQLKDAAMATLKIQTIALEFDCTLKDASAYNIQFKDGRPILIDTLSFEKYVEGDPWIAYRQFCQHFLAPLALMSQTDIRLNHLTNYFLDGIPLDLAKRLLPRKSLLRLSLLLHIHLHSNFQKKHSHSFSKNRFQVSKSRVCALIDSLGLGVKNLSWQPLRTEWAAYAHDMNYEERSFEHKKVLISQIVQQIQPQMVWDLGANTGVFSQIVSGGKVPVIAFDSDAGATEQNYLRCKVDPENKILPLVVDISNPSPAIGWLNAERTSLVQRGPADLVLALALIHHLAISNNLPFSRIANFFSAICSRWLIIEYVPKTDSWAQRLLRTRADTFYDYTQENFERSLARFFDVRMNKIIEGSERTVYFFEKKAIQ